MEVKHRTPISDFAHTFGFSYFAARDLRQLSDVLPQFLAEPAPAMLAIFTDSATDAQVLHDYYKRNKQHPST